MQYLVYRLNAKYVLPVAQLAERLSDNTLMDACICYLSEAENRYAPNIAVTAKADVHNYDTVGWYTGFK